jgi:hypothetical protein
MVAIHCTYVEALGIIMVADQEITGAGFSLTAVQPLVSRHWHGRTKDPTASQVFRRTVGTIGASHRRKAAREIARLVERTGSVLTIVANG